MTKLRTTLAVALSLTLFAGCKKKEADTGASGTADKPAESADKPAAPKTMSAPDLFADFNKPGQDGLALLDKWKPGVIVNGTVTNTISEETGLMHVWLDGENGAHVTLDFTDQGAAAKSKGVKSGDKVTAQCAVGGSDGNKMMMLTDCTLK